jgi:hypothetical protein
MFDVHVVKMAHKTAQLLSTAHRVIDGIEIQLELEKDGKIRKKKVWVLDDARNDILLNATHIDHPSSVWCRQSVENYNWLVDHLYALGQEYTYRYRKKHAVIEKCFYTLQSPPHGLREWDWTQPPSVMDDEYIISDDPIVNYRNYYAKADVKLHRWKNRVPKSEQCL